VDVLSRAAGVQLVALFSPEHGLAGRNDEKIASSKDPSTGLPVYSLYGETLRPTDEMLKGIDALVFDFRTRGVRFYTYTATMAYCMEEAAKRQHRVFLSWTALIRSAGNCGRPRCSDADKTNFVAYFPLPWRYGLTIGELAQFFNAENHIGADLHVIAMKNWHRNYFFESTGIRWIPPSPNLRTTKGSILYPGIEILQNAGVSVGRGTETPFEEFGAPWLNGDDVAAALNERHLPECICREAGSSRSPGCTPANAAAAWLPVLPIVPRCAPCARDWKSRRFCKNSIRNSLTSPKLLTLVGNSDTIQQLQSGVAPDKIVAKAWSDSSRLSSKSAASISSINSIFSNCDRVLLVMRIVSLLPSATEILFALGLEREIVGCEPRMRFSTTCAHETGGDSFEDAARCCASRN